MSIETAAKQFAKELTSEIQRLTKETERLTKLRDSVLAGSTSVSSQSITSIVRKASAKKVVANKSASNKAAAPKKKRTLSAAGRKAISDAAKRRWAERKKAQAAK